jgi:hypothetical protein
MIEYTDREKAILGELAEVEAILAEALGYQHDEQYGWVIGDHTPVSLAMEVRTRGVAPVAAVSAALTGKEDGGAQG